MRIVDPKYICGVDQGRSLPLYFVDRSADSGGKFFRALIWPQVGCPRTAAAGPDQ